MSIILFGLPLYVGEGATRDAVQLVCKESLCGEFDVACAWACAGYGLYKSLDSVFLLYIQITYKICM